MPHPFGCNTATNQHWRPNWCQFNFELPLQLRSCSCIVNTLNIYGKILVMGRINCVISNRSWRSTVPTFLVWILKYLLLNIRDNIKPQNIKTCTQGGFAPLLCKQSTVRQHHLLLLVNNCRFHLYICICFYWKKKTTYHLHAQIGLWQNDFFF